MEASEIQRMNMEKARSSVRILVTYVAAGFLFLGGTLFICSLLWKGKTDEAISLFTSILPVASSIIAFWFGTRRIDSEPKPPDQPK